MVLQIEQAGLAGVLELRACLADLCLLESTSGARLPPEHREGPRTDLTFLVERCFYL